MVVPAQTLRVVFALSALACSVILVLFVHGRAAWTTGFWVQLVAAAVGLAAIICRLVFRKGRLRLAGVPLGPFFRVFLLQLMLGYVTSALAITAIAMAVIYGVTRSGADSLALAVLAGLWLALWLAPGVAALTSWLKLRSTQGNGA